jgi:photosystem II stability/assembly factor-like uncharacterized protein
MIIKLVRLIFAIILVLFTGINGLFAQKISLLQQNKPTSIRGLCVVNDKVAWVSGSKGYVGTTKDAGRTWNWQQVKGYEKSDFRDIEAFSDKIAVIISSGTPALILKTIDGGLSWSVKYHNRDTSIFFDSMDFKGKYGCVMGDPINNRFVLFETFDKGSTWKQRDAIRAPAAKTGEAAFAASGSSLIINPGGIIHSNELMIVSGGSASFIMTSASLSKVWEQQQLPIAQGNSSSGAFSVATDNKHWVVVGGDYQRDRRTDSTVCYSNDDGKTWRIPKVTPGFQSCIKFIGNNRYISTGTSGTYYTLDGGQTWLKVDGNSYNVCNQAVSGKLIILAGNNGRIAIFTPPK